MNIAPLSDIDQTQLIDRVELARRLGFCKKTVDRIRKDGRLPTGWRMGRKAVRFYWPGVLAHLNSLGNTNQ